MAKFQLALGLHNHQPVGNFEAVFEEAHRKAYLPFLELVQEFPSVRMSLHQSGILWRWQEQAHPEYFELVGKMVDSGQIELMTGGFYEPILISIPRRDAFGQIEMLNEYIKDHFEVEPQGLWLTERIWEPHLPKLLKQSGVKYLPIDDTHFVYSGLELDQLTGPFITEHEGHDVTLLPIQKKLRYLIPFGTVEEVIAELKRQAKNDPEGLAVYADDGEKFGVWPDTHKHCYEDGWLREFFEAVQENSDWLEVIPLREAAARKPIGRAYLPSASYAEMLHWALPPRAGLEYERLESWLEDEGKTEQFGRFVRGGHWRGFLAKYEESNLMHKKMLATSARLRLAQDDDDMDTEHLAAARDRLYAGQCNCPYWHGVFGGLYLPHIRQAVHASLIEAEQRLDQAAGSVSPTLAYGDYDYDGYDEIVYADSALRAVIKPSRGGTLLELDLKKHRFCPTDTLTRRHEAYHLKLDQAVTQRPASTTASIHDLVLAKEPGLKNYLIQDWYLKRCFVDHFLTGDVDFDRFRSGRFGEEGDFILEPYESTIDEATGRVRLSRDGHLWRPEAPQPVRVVKEFKFAADAATIEVTYELSVNADTEIDVIFAVENNFNFQAGHAEDRYITVDGHRHADAFLDSAIAYQHHYRAALIDEYRGAGLAWQADRPGELWHLPIFTVSLSEGGFERVYQGTTVVKVFRLRLSREPVKIVMELKAGDLDLIARAETIGAGSESH
jgi:alpha-amylase